jgi:hypothetical protein
MKKQHLILVLVLYVVSAVISYGAFSFFAGPSKGSVSITGPTQLTEEDDGTIVGTLLTIDPNEPKDQVCPLNGAYYTQTERDAWEEKRPLFVMIENAPDARPQSGLSDADIVFETIAEGGVTRFGAMFYCGVQVFDTTLAPIRSARTYFIDWASGFNLPLYVHVGGANIPGKTDALGQIADYGWNGENDLNQFSIGYPTFVRDYNRLPGKDIATEHTMVTTTEALWEVAEERDWTNITPERRVGRTIVDAAPWQDEYQGWTFEETAAATGDVTTVSYDFWSGYGDYAVDWQYDSASDTFLRSQGGEKHLDLNDDSQVAAANVIVLFTEEEGPLNEKKHMYYYTTGTGDALLFKHGEAYEIEWSKEDREAELEFVDSKGNEIELARGLTWISVVDLSNEVTY